MENYPNTHKVILIFDNFEDNRKTGDGTIGLSPTLCGKNVAINRLSVLLFF